MSDAFALETPPSCPAEGRVSTTSPVEGAAVEVVDTRASRGHDGEGGTAPSASSAAAVTTLLAWLSPAFPVGGYAYSHGLEQAVEDGDVVDEASLEGWLTDVLSLGLGRNDAILLQAAHRAADLSPSPLRNRGDVGAPGSSSAKAGEGDHAEHGGGGALQDEARSSNPLPYDPPPPPLRAPPPPCVPHGGGSRSLASESASTIGEVHPNADPAGPSPSLSEINELALAFAPTREFHLETSQQGRSFLDALLAAWPNGRLTEIARDLDGQVAYPVAVGAAAAAHDVPATEAAAAFLVAIAQALVSAGVRLAPIGQTSGAKIVARIAPLARAIAEQTATLTIDDLANATFRLDLSSARHETQYTRLFRS